MTNEIDYKKTAFALIKPPSRVISTHLIRTKKEHVGLLAKAKEKEYCLYYASFTKKNGKHVVKQPWLLDKDSITLALSSMTKVSKSEPKPEPVPVPESKPTGLYCPYCDATIGSTPGRTLHVKSKHPEKLEEYKKWAKSLGKK